MSYIVDFKNVSTVGLESSPVAEALAGLRANEARYFMNKYKHEFMVVPASESQETLDYVNRILKEERDIEFVAKPLETSRFQVEISNLPTSFMRMDLRSMSCIRWMTLRSGPLVLSFLRGWRYQRS
jgi:hypothetical protein